MPAEHDRRCMRRIISATHFSSSALVIVAGIETRSTPSTSRAWTVLRRLALRSTSTFTASEGSPSRDRSDGGAVGFRTEEHNDVAAGQPVIAGLEPAAAEVGETLPRTIDAKEPLERPDHATVGHDQEAAVGVGGRQRMQGGRDPSGEPVPGLPARCALERAPPPLI